MGPLLFLIYINDLPNVSKCLTFFLFADDTNIYYESSDLLSIQKIVNRELRKVRKWLEANRLALNIEKTNFVLFHSNKRKVTPPIFLKIGRKKIKEENYVRFLGALLDSTLSWKYHISNCLKHLQEQFDYFIKLDTMLQGIHLFFCIMPFLLHF